MQLQGQLGQAKTERAAAGGSVVFKDDIGIDRLLYSYKLHKFSGGGPIHGRNTDETPSEDLDEE